MNKPENNEDAPKFIHIIFSKELLDLKLSMQDATIFVVISHLATSKGYCTSHNNYFIKSFGLTKNQVKYSISNLKELGLISIINPGTNKRRLIPLVKIPLYTERNNTNKPYAIQR